MSYIHTDIFTLQKPKKAGHPCGDAIGFRHHADASTIILADGLGSGIKANIAAEMCIARFLGLIEQGASLREAFSALVKTMNGAWGQHDAFAVFSVARILNNGNTTILSYDSPPPIVIRDNCAEVLENRVYTLENAVICENSTQLGEKDGLLLMSDGITQAGMGKGCPNGWESKGVADFINKSLDTNKAKELLEHIMTKTKNYWGKAKGDDCSIAYAKNRKGITVNILSGTPVDKKLDNKYITDFISSEGIKVICGGSTAMIAARELNKKLETNIDFDTTIAPPSYKIEGIHLATEGVVTLNQVNNLLNEEINFDEDDSPVFELVNLLEMADRINFFTGKQTNLAVGNMAFKQQGILPRQTILRLIKEKLIGKGKLIVVYEY